MIFAVTYTLVSQPFLYFSYSCLLLLFVLLFSQLELSLDRFSTSLTHMLTFILRWQGLLYFTLFVISTPNTYHYLLPLIFRYLWLSFALTSLQYYVDFHSLVYPHLSTTPLILLNLCLPFSSTDKVLFSLLHMLLLSLTIIIVHLLVFLDIFDFLSPWYICSIESVFAISYLLVSQPLLYFSYSSLLCSLFSLYLDYHCLSTIPLIILLVLTLLLYSFVCLFLTFTSCSNQSNILE